MRRFAAGSLGLFALVALFLTVDAWTALGTTATGERRARMEASPQWQDGVFENPQPLWNDWWGMLTGALDRSPHSSPDETPTFERTRPEDLMRAPPSGLRVTWLGHSTLLIEVEGTVILTDPVWGERTSPFSAIGPTRWYPPPIGLADLPHVDVVLISHDHYDHLDYPTIDRIRGWDAKFVAPLGVGAHLSYWGVPEAQIVEVDWWDTLEVDGLEIVCTPARHASGRGVLDQNATLWASYALIGERHRAWFSGDTGLFDGMREIGERYGPFDLTMVEVGAYNRAWPDWHLGPEQAVTAHQWVRGSLLLPIHWGLFDLANHGWTEPIERTLLAADAEEVAIVSPRAGQPFEPASPPARERWWPRLPYESADEHPIRATAVTLP